MAPLAVIDYVVIHELVHTVIRGHGPDFWKQVQAFEPEYKQYVRWLKENGAQLEI
jgi:predicted metal-dependent hydrolase